MGEQVAFIWTVADATTSQARLSECSGDRIVVVGHSYSWPGARSRPLITQVIIFDVIPMRLVSQQPTQGPLSQYRRIGDQWLIPDTASTQTGVTGTCTKQSVHGVPARGLAWVCCTLVCRWVQLREVPKSYSVIPCTC